MATHVNVPKVVYPIPKPPPANKQPQIIPISDPSSVIRLVQVRTAPSDTSAPLDPLAIQTDTSSRTPSISLGGVSNASLPKIVAATGNYVGGGTPDSTSTSISSASSSISLPRLAPKPLVSILPKPSGAGGNVIPIQVIQGNKTNVIGRPIVLSSKGLNTSQSGQIGLNLKQTPIILAPPGMTFSKAGSSISVSSALTGAPSSVSTTQMVIKTEAVDPSTIPSIVLRKLPSSTLATTTTTNTVTTTATVTSLGETSSDQKEKAFETQHKDCLNYLINFQATSVSKNARVLLNGEVCIVDGILFHRGQDGAIRVDCFVCKNPFGLVALELHMKQEHPKAELACPSPGCNEDVYSDLYMHILKSHSTFNCPRCSQVTNIDQCKEHFASSCNKVNANNKRMIPLPIRDEQTLSTQDGNCTYCHEVVENSNQHFHVSKVRCCFCRKQIRKSLYKSHLSMKHFQEKAKMSIACPICQMNSVNIKHHLRFVHAMSAEDADKVFEEFFVKPKPSYMIKLKGKKFKLHHMFE